jgi:hypothetical protein
MKGLGGGSNVDAIDQLAESLEDLDFKKVAQGNSALVDVQKSLREQLLHLKLQAEKNIEQNKKLLKREKISGKEAKILADQQAKAIKNLNDLMEEEAKNRHIGVKELSKFVKETLVVNKQLRQTSKLQREEMVGIKRSMKIRTRQVALWAKSSDRIKGATESLDTFADKLGGDFLGSGIVRHVRGGIAARGEARGGLGKFGMGAMGGMAVVGVMGALLGKLMGVRREGLEVLSPKAFNYGLQGFDSLNSAIQGTTVAVKDFRNEARQLGMEGETATQIFTEVGKQTGETDANLVAAGKTLFRTIQAGIIPAGEASSILTERINTVGISAKEAALEIETIGLIARTTGKVQMEDLYKSVQNVANASDALVTNQKDLAKAMASLVKQGDKLGMSYNRRQKAAEGLTKALSASYNTGFATLEVENDLAIAMKSRDKNISAQAATISRMRSAGTITDQRAAEMLKDIGATTEVESIRERMRRSALDITGPGGMEMAVARLGDLSFDQVQMLEEVGNKLRQGITIEEIMSKDGMIDPKTRKTFEDLSKGIGKEAFKGKSLMDSTLDDLMSNLSVLLGPILKTLPELLSDISVSMKWLAKHFGFNEKDMKRKEEEEKKKQEQKHLTETVNLMIKRATGKEGSNYLMGMLGGDSAIEEMIDSPSMQKKFLAQFKRGFSADEQAAILATLDEEDKLSAKAMFAHMKRQAAAGKTAAKAVINPGRINGAGDSVGDTITIEGERKGVARENQMLNDVRRRTSNSSARTGPGAG